MLGFQPALNPRYRLIAYTEQLSDIILSQPLPLSVPRNRLPC